MTISRDTDILGGEPRIDGTRISVRHIAARVIDADQSPASVADQFDTSLSAVYEALAYYYDHIETMREYEGANEAAFETVRETSVKPNKTIQ